MHGSPLQEFCPERLSYRFEPALGCFCHGYDRDVHMFVLWEKSRPQWDRILQDLRTRFVIKDLRFVTWPSEDVHDNFLRLYGVPPVGSSPPSSAFRRQDVVGGGTFCLVVVEDPNSQYVFHRTFSKKTELVNRNVVAAKELYRTWSGGGYRIHSSNSLGEFFRDMSLLVGVVELDRILGSTGSTVEDPLPVSRSLAGAGGWRDFGELFSHLRRSIRYLVMRNFESLPDDLEGSDADIDALCVSPQDFAALANANVRVDDVGKFACETVVGGRVVPLDLRFVGDGYFDAAWQLDMLRRVTVHRDIVMVPSQEDHFFSLLWHAKLQKKQLTQAYRTRLLELGRTIGLGPDATDSMSQDDRIAELLGGYLYSQGYQVTSPLDPWVERNSDFASLLLGFGPLWERERTMDELLVAGALARMPALWRWRTRLTRPAASAFRRLRRWSHWRSS